MNLLIEYTVFSGLVTACRFATCPTRRSSVFVMATTEGVVRPPSWLGITTDSVVPRSIPIILLIAAIPPDTNCHFHSPATFCNQGESSSVLAFQAKLEGQYTC